MRLVSTRTFRMHLHAVSLRTWTHPDKDLCPEAADQPHGTFVALSYESLNHNRLGVESFLPRYLESPPASSFR
jgi:hypothetical protein